MAIRLHWAIRPLPRDGVFAYPYDHIASQLRNLIEFCLVVIKARFEDALVELVDFLRAVVDVLSDRDY